MEKITKVFISIPITGQEEKSRTLCKEYKEKLTQMYPSVEFMSPFEIATEKGMPDSYYMGKDIERLMECDAIASVEGWQKSKGCQVERFTANIYGLKIYDMDDLVIGKIGGK